jgi:hypothetical protein
MKANLIVHCAKCGETDVTITRKPNEEAYKVYCTACDTNLARIPTYGIIFTDDEEKEDDHANPTE